MWLKWNRECTLRDANEAAVARIPFTVRTLVRGIGFHSQLT